jgi:hypothetical protein
MPYWWQCPGKDLWLLLASIADARVPSVFDISKARFPLGVDPIKACIDSVTVTGKASLESLTPVSYGFTGFIDTVPVKAI